MTHSFSNKWALNLEPWQRRRRHAVVDLYNGPIASIISMSAMLLGNDHKWVKNLIVNRGTMAWSVDEIDIPEDEGERLFPEEEPSLAFEINGLRDLLECLNNLPRRLEIYPSIIENIDQAKDLIAKAASGFEQGHRIENGDLVNARSRTL